MSHRRAVLAFALISLILSTAACGSRSTQPVENLSGVSNDTSSFVLKSLKGTRDGDSLDVQATYGDTNGRTLTARLRFDVRPPARLTSGTWQGLDQQGTVEQRAMTFLGGQSSGPSIGGRFDLLGPDHRAVYRITIPLQELKIPL